MNDPRATSAPSVVRRNVGQAGHPKGLVGRFFGCVMARLNQEMNLFTLEQLEVRPGEAVLEIGLGPGRLMALLSEAARHGTVCGVDHSDTILRQALAYNREAVRAGRVSLLRATVSLLPFPDMRFDRICSVNSFQFWPAPEGDLREVHRVLRPGGLLALTLRSGSGSSALGAGRLAEPSRVEEALRALASAEFRDLRVAARGLRYVTASCVLARR